MSTVTTPQTAGGVSILDRGWTSLDEHHPLTVFRDDVAQLFKEHVDEAETAQESAFLYRKGAFGYQEVYEEGMTTLNTLRNQYPCSLEEIEARGEVPSTRQLFLRRNIEFLTNHLEHMAETHRTQIDVFKATLLEFARVKMNVSLGVEVNLQTRSILKSLHTLNKALNTTIKSTQEKVLDLQVRIMMTDGVIRLGQPSPGYVWDLDGKVVALQDPMVPGPNYRTAFKLYSVYADEILDSDVFYCRIFLRAVNRCKQNVTEFMRENGVSAFPPAPPGLKLGLLVFKEAQQ